MHVIMRRGLPGGGEDSSVSLPGRREVPIGLTMRQAAWSGPMKTTTPGRNSGQSPPNAGDRDRVHAAAAPQRLSAEAAGPRPEEHRRVEAASQALPDGREMGSERDS
jgi:hypothetical protein